MTTSQTSFFDEILNEGGAIPEGKFAYFRERLRNKIYSFVVKEFLRKERAGQLSKADLARRLNKKPEQITRWLSVPSNWTLDTVSDLMLAIYGGELEFSAALIADQIRPRNSDQLSMIAPQSTKTGTTGHFFKYGGATATSTASSSPLINRGMMNA